MARWRSLPDRHVRVSQYRLRLPPDRRRALRAFMSLLGEASAPTSASCSAASSPTAMRRRSPTATALLQRHMAILGNTGAGKSWTVALLLERAARLQHVNMIVLDMHGEYGPLASRSADRAPVVRGMRIAGPADLLFCGEDVLHLPFWLLELDELLSLVVNEGDPHLPTTGWRSPIACRRSSDPCWPRWATARPWPRRPPTHRSPTPRGPAALARPTTPSHRPPAGGRVDPGPYNGKLSGLIARFEARMADPRYGFIFHPPVETRARRLACGDRSQAAGGRPGRGRHQGGRLL